MNFGVMPAPRWQYGCALVMRAMVGICGPLDAQFKRVEWWGGRIVSNITSTLHRSGSAVELALGRGR
jgi:hypothetical protein